MTSCGKSDFDTYAQYGYCIPTEQYYTWLIDYALAFFNVENKYQWYVDSYEKSKDILNLMSKYCIGIGLIYTFLLFSQWFIIFIMFISIPIVPYCMY